MTQSCLKYSEETEAAAFGKQWVKLYRLLCYFHVTVYVQAPRTPCVFIQFIAFGYTRFNLGCWSHRDSYDKGMNVFF